MKSPGDSLTSIAVLSFSVLSVRIPLYRAANPTFFSYARCTAVSYRTHHNMHTHPVLRAAISIQTIESIANFFFESGRIVREEVVSLRDVCVFFSGVFFFVLISKFFPCLSLLHINRRTASLPNSVTPDIHRLWKAYPFERNPASWVPPHPHGYGPGESFCPRRQCVYL